MTDADTKMCMIGKYFYYAVEQTIFKKNTDDENAEQIECFTINDSGRYIKNIRASRCQKRIFGNSYGNLMFCYNVEDHSHFYLERNARYYNFIIQDTAEYVFASTSFHVNEIAKYDIHTGKLLPPIHTELTVSCMEYHEGNDWLFVGRDQEIRWFDCKTNQLIGQRMIIDVPACVLSMIFVESDCLAFATDCQKIYIWDIRKPFPEKKMQCKGSHYSLRLSLSADKSHLLASSYCDKDFRVWNLSTFKRVDCGKCMHTHRHAEITQDGRKLIFFDIDSVLREHVLPKPLATVVHTETVEETNNDVRTWKRIKIFSNGRIYAKEV